MKKKNKMRRVDDLLGSYLSHTDYGQTQGSGLTLRSPQPIVNLRSVSAYSSEAYIISVRSRLVPEEFCLIDDS